MQLRLQCPQRALQKAEMNRFNRSIDSAKIVTLSYFRVALKREFEFSPEVFKHVINIGFQRLSVSLLGGHPSVFHLVPQSFNPV